MLCSKCGFDNPGSPRFCAGCGGELAAGAQGAPQGAPQVGPQVGPQGGSLLGRAPVPAGFTLDPGSGLYYKVEPGVSPDTGLPGRWNIWFYPDTGAFNRSFSPDAPVSNNVQRPVSYGAPQQQQSGAFGAVAGPQQVFPQAADKALSAVHIIIPVVGLLVGALVAVGQYLVF